MAMTKQNWWASVQKSKGSGLLMGGGGVSLAGQEIIRKKSECINFPEITAGSSYVSMISAAPICLLGTLIASSLLAGFARFNHTGLGQPISVYYLFGCQRAS